MGLDLSFLLVALTRNDIILLILRLECVE